MVARGMGVQRVKPGLHQIRLQGVNAFLLESNGDGLVLIDAGVPGSTDEIARAVQSLGRDLTDIRHILVTHCHSDHTGSLAELKAATSARVYMQKSDAEVLKTGKVMGRLRPSPGLINRILYRTVVPSLPTTVEPVAADEFVEDGDEIPIAGGIRVIHTPGHTPGHVVFLALDWSAIFVGDAAANLLGLRLMFTYEQVQQGVMSLAHLCRQDFDVACFGHGPPIRRKAGDRFRRIWGRRGVASQNS
jgi:glyoxylase-like metal-dependent hydrolase (beta-lactamase superfamily II)